MNPSRGARPSILYVDSDLDLAVDQACATLVAKQMPVYGRGTSLVTPVALSRPEFNNGLSRQEGSVVLVPLVKAGLVELLTRTVAFAKPTMAGNNRPISCPPVIAETIIARQGNWPFPQLRAIVSAPTLRSDGSVLANPGFDSATGILFATNRKWPEIPPRPTYKCAVLALGQLTSLVSNFPFVAPADVSGAIAMIMTALVRPSLPTAPLFGISAPTPGTGKSKLVDIAAILATGRPAAVMSPSRDETELKKQIDAGLMAGDSFLTLDNIDHPLKSEFLCQVLTQMTVKSRVLGESRNLELPTSVTMCATGNSLRFVGDLTRRVVLVNLDARTERPENRTFASDPIAIAQRQRTELVTAALTILRAFVVSKALPVRPALGSFEAWSDLVRSALVWVGMIDPLTNAERVRDDDPERERTCTILQTLPKGPWTVSEIADLLKRDLLRYGGTRQHAGLAEALADFVERDALNTSRFAAFLRKQRNRIVEGKVIIKHGDRNHTSLWRVDDTS